VLQKGGLKRKIKTLNMEGGVKVSKRRGILEGKQQEDPKKNLEKGTGFNSKEGQTKRTVAKSSHKTFQ